VVIPTPVAGLLTAGGWLDWRAGVGYLAVRDPARAGEQLLIRADLSGVASLAVRAAGSAAPLPPPRGAWQRSRWEQRYDAAGASDLDLLLNEAVGLASSGRDDADFLARTATWLRTDTVNGVAVAVFEVAKPAEHGVPRGQARLRYWIDGSGLLRRLEVRARSGGFGRLDVAPRTRVPYLPAVTYP
jgi:hypothetical protein